MTKAIDAGDGLAARVSGPRNGVGVLWIHGYTLDAGVFAPVWAALPGRRHVGLDLPGHGRSRPIRDGEDLERLATTVAAFAERIGVRHVVGLSFGTLLALQVAAARPTGLAGLVLSAPGLAQGPSDWDVERRYGELASLYRTAGPGPHMTELWMRTPPDIFRHALRRPALAATLAQAIDRHGWAELGTLSMRGLTSPAQNRAVLERVTVPTLVLMGDGELPAHRECAARLARWIPSCVVDVLKDAGHLALLERPAAAAARVDRHLSRSPNAPVLREP